MHKKISIKLLLSYLILLIIAFSISSITYNLLSRGYIINETQKQLQSEGKSIAEMLSKISLNADTLRTKLAGRTVLKAAQNFVEADIIILNKNREVVFKSIENLDRRTIQRLIRIENEVPRGYILQQTPIYEKKGIIKGYVVQFAKLQNIVGLTTLMRRTELISMIIAGVLALIISLFFEKSLVSPLGRLVQKINKYSNTKELDGERIMTGDEIQQLDEAFIAMTKSIARYDELQKSFLQNTSHELKTPLMSIQGYAEAIKDGLITGAEMEKSLDTIIEQSQRLKKTVEELIYLTRLENPDEKLTKENVDLAELLKGTCKSINPLAEAKNIQIEIQCRQPQYLYCDGEKLHRALLNLISNALRYAEHQITITASNKEERIKLTIADDGCGFRQGESEKVFDRFYKGESGNTGLGLSIVKAIVEAHHGVIIAYNAMPKGAIFEMELPIK